MNRTHFEERKQAVLKHHEEVVSRKNEKEPLGNGVYERWINPVLTAEHAPVFWRYDMSYETNPYFMERLGVNAAFNPGAIELDGTFYLVVRVEGNDRKSFFAIAESDNGVDGFRFWDDPILLPDREEETNVYDMRLVKHEDGWIYGLFCSERKDPVASEGDTSSAVAKCGIVRTTDLKSWERLPDLKTDSLQQRNVVLHPEFVDGKYALYTRPQDGFIEAGTGGGIGWGLTDSMENPIIERETIIDPKVYHTIKETKNGQGPAPIKTGEGWIHIAHGVRNTAAGLRYVLYAFLTDLNEPDRVIRRPGGFLLAPEGNEYIGDVSNVAFCNGAVVRDSGDVYIYYATADKRCHVATTTVGRLLDYVLHTPEDRYRSYESVKTRNELIWENKKLR